MEATVSAPVKETGPRTYRFTVVDNTASRTGEIILRQRLAGEYTRGLADQQVIWKSVVQADANGATAPFSHLTPDLKKSSPTPSTTYPPFPHVAKRPAPQTKRV